MNKIALLLLMIASTSFAQTSDDEKTSKALWDLGVRDNGTMAAAMSGLSTDRNGNEVEEMVVFFSMRAGGANLEARDVTLYESDKNSVLVMTYMAEQTKDALVTKTRIIPVKDAASKLIASVVKANSEAEDSSSSDTLKISKYKIAKLSCVKGVYPGAQAACRVTK